MLRKEEAERCLFCQAADLRNLAVRNRLIEGVPILLVFCYIASEACRDGFVDLHGFVACLWMVRGIC